MTQILIALSLWIHALATVVLIGHYLLLSLIYLPVMAKDHGTILSEISRASRGWLYLALLVFTITGIYLTLVDSNYRGFGNFGEPWAVLMLVKHVLVVGMIVMGFWFNAILRVGPMMSAHSGAEQAAVRFRSHANLMALAGVLILLLTALAQVQ